MDNNHKCPYCSRKIKYSTRLLEHGNGEHMCSHCNKPSNISQNSKIWSLLIICSLSAAVILLFYLIFGNIVDDAYKDHGTLGFLVFLFFGKAKTVKWIFWELIPFAVFFFMSPKYMEFVPLRRYMEQTPSKIDLTVPNMPVTSESNNRTSDGGTRKIPKVERAVHTGVFEDISSSSQERIDKTRHFDVYSGVSSSENEEETVNVTPKSTSKSDSYRSDVPLRKISREVIREVEYEEEYIPTRERKPQPTPEKNQRPTQGNYSGNRKF